MQQKSTDILIQKSSIKKLFFIDLETDDRTNLNLRLTNNSLEKYHNLLKVLPLKFVADEVEF